MTVSGECNPGVIGILDIRETAGPSIVSQSQEKKDEKTFPLPSVHLFR
jgi:hypothetical protein